MSPNQEINRYLPSSCNYLKSKVSSPSLRTYRTWRCSRRTLTLRNKTSWFLKSSRKTTWATREGPSGWSISNHLSIKNPNFIQQINLWSPWPQFRSWIRSNLPLVDTRLKLRPRMLPYSLRNKIRATLSQRIKTIKTHL